MTRPAPEPVIPVTVWRRKRDPRPHFQSDLPVDGAVTVPIALGVIVVDHDFVAEEADRFRPPMSDQGLALGKFQLETMLQEPPDLVLDILGFPSRTSESQQPIVRVADIMQPSEAWIVGVAGGELLQLPTHRPRFLPPPLPFHLPDGLVHPHIRPIRLTLASHIVDG